MQDTYLSPLIVRTHSSEHRHESAELWSTCGVMCSLFVEMRESRKNCLVGIQRDLQNWASAVVVGNKERMVCAVMGNVKADCLSVPQCSVPACVSVLV